MPIEQFFIQLVFILLAAKLFGELAARLAIPKVLGELLAGILLGSSFLNIVILNEFIKLFAEIGIILLLFEVGLETDFKKLIETGKKPFIVAIGGVILPAFLSFLVSYYLFNLNLLISLFIASTLTATSIGITMRVLSDLKKHLTEESQIVLGAAVLDDMIGIIILSVLYEFSVAGKIEFFNSFKVLCSILLFCILVPFLARLFSIGIKKITSKDSSSNLISSLVLALIFFFSWLAYQMQAPLLLGGFISGLALSKEFFFPYFPKLKGESFFTEQVEKAINPFVAFFSPIFFTTIGLSLNFYEINWSSPFIWIFSSCILLAAIFGKLASGFLLIKEKRAVKWAIGLAMIPRGEVGLIFAEMGKSSKIFSTDIYTSLIIVITITTLFTPFILRIFYSYQEKKLLIKRG